MGSSSGWGGGGAAGFGAPARVGARAPTPGAADVVMSAVAAVSWALVVMAGVAAAGLHLLGADAAGGSLGAMTAAVVVLAVGGTVTPSGDVSVFGLEGAGAQTAVDIAPLGVGLAGASVLALVFLRPVRAVGFDGRQLLVRGAAVVVLFVAMAGALAWVGHDVVTLDGVRLPGARGSGGGGPGRPGGGSGGLEIPGLGDVGDIGGIGGAGDVGGLLPDRIGDLVDAKARVGFSVRTGPTLLGALVWVVAVLLIAVAASRRTGPGAPRLLAAVRPAVSATVAALQVTVAAALAAAVWAAAGDDHPRMVLGGALLGAPNGAWSAVPLGMFVPFDGRVSGRLAGVLPDPLDRLLGMSAREPVTVGRLAGYDDRVWLLVAAVAGALLYAGTLAGVRTARRPAGGRSAFAARAAVRMGLVWAVVTPLLVWLTGVSVSASLSVLGVDAFGAALELHGQAGPAALLGAGWGALAGGAGALLAFRRAPLAAAGAAGPPAGYGSGAPWPTYGPYAGPGAPYGPGHPYGPAGPGAAYGPAGPYAPRPGHGPPTVNPYRDGPGAGRSGGRDVSTDETIAGPPPGAPWRGSGGRGRAGPDRSTDATLAGPPPPPPPRPRQRKPPFTPPPPPGPPPDAPRTR
ncbi:streptophobe family protein [Streptomyces sp. NRRL S-87]|uniref:streptophobe family protein n=1 Tax=Streptomyces sp. NRRL S-87 TaxID=1463920 RepID=UPI000A97F897|nr:streptophobe family protein [Streptomyces sp. NRRL S-87]